MYILGINESHGASACLFKDGQIVAAVMEERFSRLKNDETYPKKSIDFCLQAAGISGHDVGIVAMASRSLNLLYSMYKRNSGFSVGDWLKEQDEYWRPRLLEGKSPSYRDIFASRHDPERFPYYYDVSEFRGEADYWDAEKFLALRKRTVCQHLGISEEKIRVIPHWYGHIAYAFYASPLLRQPTVILHMESGGDGKNASVSTFVPGEGIRPLCVSDKCPLGRIYKFMTLVMGMKPAQHEYKIMGLAPYASEQTTAKTYSIFKDLIAVKGLDFLPNPELTDSYFYFIERLRGHRFDGIAAALQRFTEEVIVAWAKNALCETGLSQLVFSGGVSLNVKVNKLLGELPEVERLFVPPSGGDESLAIGAAYAVYEDLARAGEWDFAAIAPLAHAYLGPEYGAHVVEAALAKHDIAARFNVHEHANHAFVAQQLAAGKVIARLTGPMEFGVRSLGNRSILAHPGYPDIVKKINDQIKYRDFWMPFCPTVKAERAADYLVNPKGFSAPYMTLAFDSVPACREAIKGALHPADYTARPQILTRGDNPSYYDLLCAFERETGIGALLNTSLNLHGSPVDCTPEDGLQTFLNSKLDGILLGDTLVLR